MEEGIFTREERDKLLQEIERLKFENNRLSQQIEKDTYKAFFDAYPDIVFKINTNYIVSFIHLPYRTPDYIESITNKHMFDLTPPSFQPAMKSALDEGFHTGKPVVYTCEGDFLGEYRYYENYLSPIKDNIGNITEMFFYSRDVTVQKNIQ